MWGEFDIGPASVTAPPRSAIPSATVIAGNEGDESWLKVEVVAKADAERVDGKSGAAMVEAKVDARGMLRARARCPVGAAEAGASRRGI